MHPVRTNVQYWLGLLIGSVLLGVLLLPFPSLAANSDCLECHGIDEDVVDLDPHQRVNPTTWQASIHFDAGLGCEDCHEGKDEFPHDESVALQRCANCHEDAADEFAHSVHATNIEEHEHSSPWIEHDYCTSCHGEHDVLAVDDPNSKVYFRNIPETCGSCHGDSDIILSEGLSSAPVDKYTQSVHGHMLEDPDSEPAVCTACHGSHEIVRANDPESMINPFQISKTCGACHETVAEEYQGSVHGVAFQRGVSASPVCTDCHGIHSIKVVVHDDASTREQHLVRTTCPACHASEAIMGEYGVARARVETYDASYHGLAHTRGSRAVADCASCHGIHAIYPSTDARSSVAPENLQETCGHCHPNASEEFVRSPVHYDETNVANLDVVITNWVKRIYLVLILVVIGGMIVHNAIIIFPYIRQKLRSEQRERGRPRFSRSQMIQHSMLFTTFFLLVISGFMLAYPNTWWSEMLVGLGITESIRRWVHRIAALGMIAVSVYHVFWLFSSPYGRGELKRIAPGLRDMREFRQNMLFHLGLSKQQAGFAKFDYPAKMEYWALVWGTIIMALTGVILWFPVWATSFMPFWILKVAEVVHLFEAWLATLAIVIFHFFYVMGHPSIYPLNLAMFHGRMDPDLAEHHHPGWTPDGDPKLRSNDKKKAPVEEAEKKDTVQV